MVGKVVRLKGREHPGGKYVCPTRLIMEGTITVSRWKVVRRSCS
jgi:hypothetical protein